MITCAHSGAGHVLLGSYACGSLDPNPPGSLTATLDYPSVVVDERATNTGVGAGDVYVAFEKFSVTAGGIRAHRQS
jgi:hypothetical protein